MEEKPDDDLPFGLPGGFEPLEPFDPDDDPALLRPLLPAADRVWRHPSELGGRSMAAAIDAPPPPRPLWATTVVIGVACVLAVVAVTATSMGVRATGGRIESQNALVIGAVTGLVEASTPPTAAASVPVTTLALRAHPATPTTAATFVAPTTVAPATTVHASAPKAPPSSDQRSGVTAASSMALVSVDGGAWAPAVPVDEQGTLVTPAGPLDGITVVSVRLASGDLVAGQVVGADDPTGLGVIRVTGHAVAAAPLGSAASIVGRAATALVTAADGSRGTRPCNVVPAMASMASDDGDAMPVIQTTVDAPAGTPILDAQGRIVAITVTAADSAHPATAIPMEVAERVASQMADGSTVRLAWLGVTGRDLTTAEAGAAGVASGAVIESVAANGPAANAGIQAGDVVVGFDGQPVPSMVGLTMLVRGSKAGTVVHLQLRRAGTLALLDVTLQAGRPHQRRGGASTTTTTVPDSVPLAVPPTDAVIGGDATTSVPER